MLLFYTTDRLAYLAIANVSVISGPQIQCSVCVVKGPTETAGLDVLLRALGYPRRLKCWNSGERTELDSTLQAHMLKLSDVDSQRNSAICSVQLKWAKFDSLFFPTKLAPVKKKKVDLKANKM